MGLFSHLTCGSLCSSLCIDRRVYYHSVPANPMIFMSAWLRHGVLRVLRLFWVCPESFRRRSWTGGLSILDSPSQWGTFADANPTKKQSNGEYILFLPHCFSFSSKSNQHFKVMKEAIKLKAVTLTMSYASLYILRQLYVHIDRLTLKYNPNVRYDQMYTSVGIRLLYLCTKWERNINLKLYLPKERDYFPNGGSPSQWSKPILIWVCLVISKCTVCSHSKFWTRSVD